MSQKWPIPPTLDIRGHELAFSSDYALLMASLRLTHEFRVIVVDLRSGKQYDCPNPNLYGPVLDAKFIPGTYLVMFSASDSPLYLWNIFEQRIEEWIHHYDHSLNQIAFSNQGFWIAVATGTGLLLYDRRERVILEELDLPNADDTSLITFSPDDDKIAVRDEKRIWLVDMDSLLALDPAPATRGDSDFFISNSGRSVAYVAHNKIEVQDVSTGRALCTSSLEDVKDAGLDGLAFSPDDQHVALMSRPSIFSWNLTTAELQHTFTEPGYGRLLALSNKDNNGDQWIATNPSFRDVSVLNTTTGNRERWITSSDPVLENPDALAFTSCHLGVLWCSRVLSPGPEPGSENALFVLYNIKTGEQISRVNTSWRSSLLPLSQLFLSPCDNLVMTRVSPYRNLRVAGLETGLPLMQLTTNSRHITFLDKSNVSARQGIFSLGSVLMDGLEQLKITCRDSTRTTIQQLEEVLPIVRPAFEGYGCSLEFDWITLDGTPLLWLPQQYRGDEDAVIATGFCHVMIESPVCLYFVRFKNNAKESLRQGICNLGL